MGAAFGDSSLAFDVVNEAISDSGNPRDIFKNNTWFPVLPDYVEEAFALARAAAPRAQLFYNEYGAEGMGVKSDKVFALASSLVAKGLLDGVGLQMHISVDSYPSKADVSANMARLVALGLEVHITEMDVRCSPDAQAGAVQCAMPRWDAAAGAADLQLQYLSGRSDSGQAFEWVEKMNNGICFHCIWRYGKIEFIDKVAECIVCADEKSVVRIFCGHELCLDCWTTIVRGAYSFDHAVTCPMCRRSVFTITV
jgi:GH35 family endo-1,4-beta-xylanase